MNGALPRKPSSPNEPTVRRARLTDLEPAEHNPRTISPEAMAGLRAVHR